MWATNEIIIYGLAIALPLILILGTIFTPYYWFCEKSSRSIIKENGVTKIIDTDMWGDKTIYTYTLNVLTDVEMIDADGSSKKLEINQFDYLLFKKKIE